MRRVEKGVFELMADADVTFRFRGTKLEIAADRKEWKTVAGAPGGGWIELGLEANKMTAQPLYVRVTP
jgi:hypothetical protein